MPLAWHPALTFSLNSQVKNSVLLKSYVPLSVNLGVKFFFPSGAAMLVSSGHLQCQIFSPTPLWPGAVLLMEKDESRLAKSALVLINDGNLSADSQSASQPGCGLTITIDCKASSMVGVGPQMQHNSDGEMKRQSTDHQSAKKKKKKKRTSGLLERVFQAQIEAYSHIRCRAGPLSE